MMGRAAQDPGDTFALELALVTPAQQLREWYAGAADGHVAQYAVGVALPRQNETIDLVRTWVDEGMVVHLPQERDRHQRGRFCWRIRKLGRPSPSPCAAGHAGDCDATLAQLETVLAMVRRAASRGERCPSRSAIAAELGLKPSDRSRQRAGYLLRRLQAAGEIKLRKPPRGSQAGPVATILRGRGKGRSTKGEFAKGGV